VSRTGRVPTAPGASPPVAEVGGGALIEHIHPRQSYLRAANLERHHDQAEHYIPTGRALEILRRLLHTVEDPTVGRAWSLTGPYGAGKSSFALFLRTLLGPANNRRHRVEHALREADPGLADTLTAARARLGSDTRGLLLATTTCQLEPLTDSLLRALTLATAAYWPKGSPRAVSAALTAARAARSARSVVAAVDALAAHAPVLLVLDEFGKTLEHFAAAAAAGGDGDLFVLQEIAERASGTGATPVFVFTLQHLAFDDYVRKASAAQRREWGKVQGRFEDIPFLETSEQSLRLVAGALDDTCVGEGLRARREQWADAAYGQVAQLGLASQLSGGAAALARCYPLHPVTLLALPELCAQLGQHGRTLFSFLASGEPHTATDFLTANPVPAAGEALPVLGLPKLYDFFAGPAHALAASVGGSRWREIDERVREAAGLDVADLACLKTVGLLNLLGHVGLRASADLVAYALGPAEELPQQEVRDRLTDLVEGRGWLTYRAFADEYRLWQGSDVDLRGRVADAREQLLATSPAELLSRLQAAAPLIAGKHSQRVGMLRYFTVRYADATTVVPPLAADEPADGALVYYLDDPAAVADLRGPGPGRPIVLAVSDTAARVRDAAVEAAAALAVLNHADVLADRVARRELQDRVADARGRLAATLAASFAPGAPGVTWRWLDEDGPGQELDGRRGLSRLLSEVCERAYRHSPEIRNEMLGRRELTSQGAKARRNLLEAMVTAHGKEKLGLTGYGPERAMYEAVLAHTGLHRRDAVGTWRFTQPSASTLATVWGALIQDVDRADDEPVGLDALYARLMAPPIGLKDGPIPVLLTAFLLHRHDDVAVYEDGTYQPALTTDLLERLLKTPHRFAVKAFSAAGARGALLTAVNDLLAELTGQPVQPRRRLRNATILATAAPLLSVARDLPDYTRHTGALSPTARAVRDALLAAREPDELLFRDLPQACELAPFGPGLNGRTQDVPVFADRLRRALIELEDAYPTRLTANGAALAAELNLPDTTTDLRAALAVRAGLLDGKVLDPKLRSFLFTALETDLDDHSWLEALSLTIGERPPAVWRDDDVSRFQNNLHALLTGFRRVEALHFDAAARATTDGFTPCRLTKTNANGSESSRVVYVDDAARDQLTDVAEQALHLAAAQLGAPGRDALLALLADLVLTPPAVAPAALGGAVQPASGAPTRRKASGG
jgi:hypothetical protein